MIDCPICRRAHGALESCRWGFSDEIPLTDDATLPVECSLCGASTDLGHDPCPRCAASMCGTCGASTPYGPAQCADCRRADELVEARL